SAHSGSVPWTVPWTVSPGPANTVPIAPQVRCPASARPREAMNRIQQLRSLRRRIRFVAWRQRAGDAVADVLVEHPERERLERRVHGGDLRQDLDAVAVVLDHPLDTAHLALDAVQALDQRVLVLRVAVDGTLGDVAHGLVLSLPLSKRRRRRLFVATKRLDAAAIIGLRSPATASGIAATLRANAQNRFPLIVRSVLRASRIASAAARRSPDTSVRSDAS